MSAPQIREENEDEVYNDLGERVPATWACTRIERVAQSIYETLPHTYGIPRDDLLETAEEAITEAERGFERHRAASREESKQHFERLRQKR